MAGLREATTVQASDNGLLATLYPAWSVLGPKGGCIAALALVVVRERADAGQAPCR